MKRITLILALLSFPMIASAQFYQNGNEPASIRWRTFKSANYKMIFPKGTDSLALVYNAELEKWQTRVGLSVGFLPNQQYHKQLDIVLHSMNSSPNGFVAWAPRRMELYTVPQAYSPDPIQWHSILAIHESRHVAQMQMGRYKDFRLLHWLTGESAAGALSAIYPGPALLEGDAVTAETGLTNMGRGRSADFLEYNMLAFDSGDYRNWYRWRYGSIVNFTPDYYRLGYLTIAGMRSFYDDPLFTKKYYERIFSKRLGYPLFNFQKTIREQSGKNLKGTWHDIAEGFRDEWAANSSERAPFMEFEPVMDKPKSYREYTGSATDGKNIYAVEWGLKVSSRLVRINQDGAVEKLVPMPSEASDLAWSAPMGMLYWSESVCDPRWEMKENSVISCYNPDNGSTFRITEEGRYFNPAPHPTERILAMTEYPLQGGSSIVIMNLDNYSEILRYEAPDSLQVVECAWTDDGLVASAIGPTGFGIYAADHGFAPLTEAIPRKIKQLRQVGGHLEFLCDRNGVHELYMLKDGSVYQLTNSRYGVSDVLHIDGMLYCSSLFPEGRLIVRKGETQGTVIDLNQCWDAPTPEKLSAQERELALEILEPDLGYEHGEIRNYSKLTHAMNVHSWFPMFFDYDNLQSISMDQNFLDLALGATFMFQDHHGFSGSIGYSRHAPNDVFALNRNKLNSFHAKIDYRGLYPVIETELDVNDRAARIFTLNDITGTNNQHSRVTAFSISEVPYISGSVKVYVPLSFNKGGWSKGVIPQAKLVFSNDIFNTGVVYRGQRFLMASHAIMYSFKGYTPGHTSPMQKLYTSIRAFSTLATTSAAVYPRLGAGVELGAAIRPGLTEVFSPNLYLYSYGYLPGLFEGHGIKLTFMGQRIIAGDSQFRENSLNVAPSGLTDDASLMDYITDNYPTHAQISADYAFKAIPLEWSWLSPLAYIRNMEFHITGEFAAYGSRLPSPSDHLYGVGGTIAFNLGNFLWVPYDTCFGVSYSRSGGSLLDTFTTANTSRDHLKLVFYIDM